MWVVFNCFLFVVIVFFFVMFVLEVRGRKFWMMSIRGVDCNMRVVSRYLLWCILDFGMWVIKSVVYLMFRGLFIGLDFVVVSFVFFILIIGCCYFMLVIFFCCWMVSWGCRWYGCVVLSFVSLWLCVIGLVLRFVVLGIWCVCVCGVGMVRIDLRMWMLIWWFDFFGFLVVIFFYIFLDYGCEEMFWFWFFGM